VLFGRCARRKRVIRRRRNRNDDAPLQEQRQTNKYAFYIYIYIYIYIAAGAQHFGSLLCAHKSNYTGIPNPITRRRRITNDNIVCSYGVKHVSAAGPAGGFIVSRGCARVETERNGSIARYPPPLLRVRDLMKTDIVVLSTVIIQFGKYAVCRDLARAPDLL